MPPVREISAETITETVRKLYLLTNVSLGGDVRDAVREGLERETSPAGRDALEKILENADIAEETGIPICQDTGLPIVFLELGQDVHVSGGDLGAAVQEGIRRASRDGYFRKSVCDPLTRENTGDNTPAVVHTEIVPGDGLRIAVMAKGGGSENMSSVDMMLPGAGPEGIRDLVVERVRRAGPNPCPPVIVGVGIGGSLERAALISKKALLRPVGRPHPSGGPPALLEREILEGVNRLGIGPQGYGGAVTALAVHVEMEPCHLASLPVAVTLQCHAARHREETL
ncbi:MAG TPA: fumarate hydratase [Syntrophales bacterium]|nr:fumarate hydratase [Syntrophales bacterium]